MSCHDELLYLSKHDVEEAGLSMAECIDILEEAHIAKSKGLTEMPDKPRLGLPPDGFLEAFPARIFNTECIGVKWLGGNRNNPKIGVPPITGLIILNDPVSWRPVAVMDCTYITGLRTAGVSGIVLRHMANPDSSVVTVLGCGLQGRTHLAAAMSECHNIKKVIAWGPHEHTVESFVREAQEKYDVEVKKATNIREAVEQADVLLSSTPFGETDSFRIIHSDWLKPGVTAVPASTDNHFFPDALLSFDKYYIDDRKVYMQMHEEGTCKALDFIPPELGDFLAGKTKGRETAEERIILITGGIGINDVSVAHRIFMLARQRGIGQKLEL